MSCGEPPLGRSGGSLWFQGRNPDLIPLIAGHRAQKRGGVPYILTPKENEQAPVIPLCNCCVSTRRPIETGPIFRNSFMTFLTHMQFHGLKTKIPALLEFMLKSPFLIFPCLLLRKPRKAQGRFRMHKTFVLCFQTLVLSRLSEPNAIPTSPGHFDGRPSPARH